MEKTKKKIVKKEPKKIEFKKDRRLLYTGLFLILLQISCYIATIKTGFASSILIYDELNFEVIISLIGYFSLAIIGGISIIYYIFKDKKEFIKESRQELKKVKWPSRKDMITYVPATLIFCLFFGAFFYILDLLFALMKGWLN